MPNPWTHPTLGKFVADNCGWSTKLRIPEFDAFSYDSGRRNARRSGGEYPLSIRWLSGGRRDVPPAEMVSLAEDVIAHPRELVAMVASALWEDFNGRGLLPAAWWHGAIDDINRRLKLDKLPPLNGPDDIPALLALSDITVWNEVYDHPAPIAHLGFHAAFEVEHGVNIFTDGREILGASIQDDLTLYRQPGAPVKKIHNPFL